MESKRTNATIHGVSWEDPGLKGVTVFRNFFSHDECDQILEDSKDWPVDDALIYRSTEPDKERNIDHGIRKGKVRHYPRQRGSTWIHDIILRAGEYYKLHYPLHPIYDDNKVTLEVAEYIDEGDHFEMHSDMQVNAKQYSKLPNDTRKLSMSCILADEHAGGEFAVQSSKGVMKVELYKGDIICFPSYHRHRVEKLLSGYRASLIVWLEGDFWR